MEKKTMVLIGALILLAVIPIGVVALTDSETGPACCGQVQACDSVRRMRPGRRVRHERLHLLRQRRLQVDDACPEAGRRAAAARPL